MAADSELVRLVRELIRFDTTNPPGNETPCAEFLAELFRRERIEPELLESAPGRGNVLARLKGDGSKPPLLLSAHLDVVPALDGWTHPAFAAEIHDGCVWGRGAIDMKHMAAMSVLALLEIKRKGLKLKRDLIFAGVADEEAGGRFGAGWLVDNHPEKIRAEYCLTEVGGMTVSVGGRTIVPVQVAQKGYLWFKLRARGAAGHGSKPKRRSAIEKLAAAVHALSTRPLQYRLTRTTRNFLEALRAIQPPAAKAALRGLYSGKTARLALKLFPEEKAEAIYAMLHDTVAVTGLAAGVKVNVIPDSAEATVDGRYLPGTTREQFLAEVQALVGPEIELEPFDGAEPLEREHEGPLWDQIVKVMGRHLPSATVVPNMITGMTDAKDFDRLGIMSYGFSPIELEEGEQFSELYHAPNERVSVAGLEKGSRWLTEVVEGFCA